MKFAKLNRDALPGGTTESVIHLAGVGLIVIGLALSGDTAPSQN